MKSFSATHKALLAGMPTMAFGIAAVLSVGAKPEARPARPAAKAGPERPHHVRRHDLPQHGEPVDKGVPDKVDAEGPNVALEGRRSAAGPTAGRSSSGGKVFVGTNNEQPRNKRDMDKNGDPIDKGILMCFDEKTGKFLWQAVHDKLPSGHRQRLEARRALLDPGGRGRSRLLRQQPLHGGLRGRRRDWPTATRESRPRKYKDPTDADIIWEFDMIKELNVFPHNMSACSPLIVGDILYVVTANGVDEGHINIPSPEAPSFIALDKKTGKLLWKSNAPGKNIMHGQWSNPVYGEINGVRQVIFPGGDGWLRGFVPRDRRADLEVRLQPEGRGVRTRRHRHQERLHRHAGRPRQQGLHRRRPGSRAHHRHRQLLLHRADEGQGRHLEDHRSTGRDKPTASRSARSRTRTRARSGATAASRTAKWAPRDFKFGRTMSTACIVDDIVYISELPGSCTASTPRPASTTGSSTPRRRSGARRTTWMGRSSSATTRRPVRLPAREDSTRCSTRSRPPRTRTDHEGSPGGDRRRCGRRWRRSTCSSKAEFDATDPQSHRSSPTACSTS